MKIEIRDEDDMLVLTDEDTDNHNFVGLELYSEHAKSKDNPLGLVGECLMPIDELVVAAEAFASKRKSTIDQSNNAKL